MISIDLLQSIKKHTISALVADEILLSLLVLKGGNALDLVYEISNRGSIDIDFSIQNDFSEEEKMRIKNQIEGLLNDEFSKIGFVAFDVTFSDTPKVIVDEVKDFWGGYCLEFKIIDRDTYVAHADDKDRLRMLALPINPDSSPKFKVDISKYEYVNEKKAKDLEGTTVYVYTPEMLAIEKIRALCQQSPEYRSIVRSMTSKSRARDFYDIYNLSESFSIDYCLPANIELMQHIFSAKHVPIKLISAIPEQRELHRHTWESVISTIGQSENVQSFDYYFDYVISKLNCLPATTL